MMAFLDVSTVEFLANLDFSGPFGWSSALFLGRCSSWRSRLFLRWHV